MAWNAKPKWGYATGSQENQENTLEINGQLNGEGFSLASQVGMLSNMQEESGLNPWRLEGDYADIPWNTGKGYGLFQYTPAWMYLDGCQDLPGYAPNTNYNAVMPGAHPEDGYAQILCFTTDQLSKWNTYPWVDSWSKTTYSHMWSLVEYGVQTYGDGVHILLSQFKQIQEEDVATAIFLGAFERPLTPNLSVRLANNVYFSSIVSGDTPVPPPPGPFPSVGSSFKIMFYLKSKRRRFYGY